MFTSAAHVLPAAAAATSKPSSGPTPTVSATANRNETFNIVSFNVNGLRSASMKPNHPLSSLFESYTADIFCCQETKMSSWDDVDSLHGLVPGYTSYFSFSRGRKGWSGVATYVREGCTVRASENLNDTRTDGEGRILVTDHGRFILLNCYFPNGGLGPERIEYKMQFYAAIEEKVGLLLAQGRHVVIVGDVNTAHDAIDICCPPEQAEGSTGFLREERAWLDGMVRRDLTRDKVAARRAAARAQPMHTGALDAAAASCATAAASSVAAPEDTLDCDDSDTPLLHTHLLDPSSLVGSVFSPSASHSSPPPFIDSYRYFYPNRRGAYTFWDQRRQRRETNLGCRIDYMLVDTSLMLSHAADAEIHARQRGSDHCPTSLHFHLPPPLDHLLASPASTPPLDSRMARIARFLDLPSFPLPAPVSSVSSAGKSKFQKQGSLRHFFGGLAAAAANSNNQATSAAENSKRKEAPTHAPTHALAALASPPSTLSSYASSTSPPLKKAKTASVTPLVTAAGTIAIETLFRREKK